MSMVSWHIVTKAAYDAAAASAKTDDKLFFLSDTQEIYRGTKPFTQAVTVFTEEPAAANRAVGRLYVNGTTLEGKVWDGTNWKTVIQPVQSTLAKADTSKPVSGKAVADYVQAEIEAVTGSGDLVSGLSYNDGVITVTMADDSTSTLDLDDVAFDLAYNSTTGLLQVKNANGTAIGTGINLDLERFVTSASYNAQTHKIILVFNDAQDPVEIDVGDLIDTYTAENSKDIKLTVTNNKFKAEAIIASGSGTGYDYTGNLLTSTDKGLYVAPVDLSGKVDKMTGATAGHIVTALANGNVQDSGLVAGGATIAATPNATTLITEAAVDAIRTALTNIINTKMAKVETGHTGEVIVAAADGDAAASGKKLGGATFEASPSGSTMASEAGVVAYTSATYVAKASIATSSTISAASPSDELVTSEKAVVDALSWKTSV